MTGKVQLTIDSSTDTASLAVTRDGDILAELSWQCRRNHSVELMPHIAALLEQDNICWDDIELIIVARGPGSFNGLRVGLTTAKGLAFGLGVPIIGIDTLEAAAWAHASYGLPVCAVLPAGGSEFAAAIYRQQGDAFRNIVASHITKIGELSQQIKETTIFCGDLSTNNIASLCNILGPRAIIPPPAARLRRAGFLAELGLRRFAAGDFDDARTLQPIYLRRPQITQPKSGNWLPEGVKLPD